MKIPRVIPVIEMASKLFQSVHGAEGVFQAFGCCLNSNPAKIAGREGRKQIQPDIRRRGSVGDDGLRIFLKIIWRKEVVHGSNKSLKEAPSAARHEPESGRIGRRESLYVRKAWRKADPARNGRGGNPQRNKGGCGK